MMPERRFRAPAAVASFLSFLIPGLGQAAAGRPIRGLLIAIPAILVLAAAGAVWFFDRDLYVRIGLSPQLLLFGVIGSLALFAYRFWAIVDAYLVARRRAAVGHSRTFRIASVLVLILLLSATTYMHGYAAYLGLNARDTLITVFDPNGPAGAATPTPAPTPTASGSPIQTDTPEPTPSPTPVPGWAEDGYLNVLAIGSDAGPGRWSMRADAIILISVQIDTGRVAAFSVPRYTRGVPLAEPEASAFACGCLMDDYFNALYVYANQHPDIFPGDDDVTRGLSALSGAAEAFFGVHLDGMAVADLNGFIDLVNAVGGIDINAPESLYDATYPNPSGGDVEIYFPAGPQHLDGWHALAYARTRHQDGDVHRMGRQQQVIAALGHQVRCNLVGRLPALLHVARDALWTNLPLQDVPDMLQIHPGPVESHVLFDTYNITLTPEIVARVQHDVATAFDGPAPTPAPSDGSSSSGC